MHRGLIVAALLLIAERVGQSPGADLRVTDVHGTQVRVREAVVDYGKWYSVDNVVDGIRVLQGAGVVTLKWADVDSLRVTGVDSAEPPRLSLDVALRNHNHAPATLFRDGHMKLLGRTELGTYAIDLEQIRLIVPVR